MKMEKLSQLLLLITILVHFFNIIYLIINKVDSIIIFHFSVSFVLLASIYISEYIKKKSKNIWGGK